MVNGYLIVGKDQQKVRIFWDGAELVLRTVTEYEMGNGWLQPVRRRYVYDDHFVRPDWRVPELPKSGYSDAELKRILQGKWVLGFGLNWFWKKESRELVRTTAKHDIYALEFRADGTCFISSSSSDMDGNPWGGVCTYTIEGGRLKVPEVGLDLRIGFKSNRLQLFSEMEWSFVESMTRELRFMPDKE